MESIADLMVDVPTGAAALVLAVSGAVGISRVHECRAARPAFVVEERARLAADRARDRLRVEEEEDRRRRREVDHLVEQALVDATLGRCIDARSSAREVEALDLATYRDLVAHAPVADCLACLAQHEALLRAANELVDPVARSEAYAVIPDCERH